MQELQTSPSRSCGDVLLSAASPQKWPAALSTRCLLRRNLAAGASQRSIELGQLAWSRVFPLQLNLERSLLHASGFLRCAVILGKYQMKKLCTRAPSLLICVYKYLKAGQAGLSCSFTGLLTARPQNVQVNVQIPREGNISSLDANRAHIRYVMYKGIPSSKSNLS